MINKIRKFALLLLVGTLLFTSCADRGGENGKESESALTTETTSTSASTTKEDESPFSKYETYVDTDGKKVIKLLTKDFEKKYEAYKYDELTLEELQALTNETLLMFKEFDRIVIDLNPFGEIEPKNEDKTSVSPLDLKFGITKIKYANSDLVTQLPYRYKKDIETDNERVKAFLSENERVIKDGVLTINNVAISQFVDSRPSDSDTIKNELISEYLLEETEITMLRIWYYIGMPQIIFETTYGISPFRFYITQSEKNEDYYSEYIISTSSTPPRIYFKKGDTMYSLLEFNLVYGSKPEDGYIPELPIKYPEK